MKARGEVRIPGYMVRGDDAPDSEGRVNRFLLVPDAGNWLHAPHLFDPAEVVAVTLVDGKRLTVRERVAVWVTGKLSRRRITNSTFDAGFTILAREAEEMPQSR
jgi:hypothetical protein